ncbi:hypothetical protein [Streptomyces sp. NPDC018947]|uniref:hypothetical protein n=1 Tax=Streptomyces sp. NPDC018947 TaxID=3365054 RepID=UPI003794FA24
MSDVTRQPGAPAERAPHTPGTRADGVPPGLPEDGTYAGQGVAGTGPDAVPGRRTDPTGTGVGATPGRPGDGTHAGQGVGSTGVDVAPDPTGTGVRAGAAAGTHAGHGPATPDTGTAHGDGLLPPGECDLLGERLRHAVTEFVDAPRASVEEADRVLEEVAARLADAVAHRRRTLRTSWQETGGESRATSTDTEQLRLALRDYRELADRLMHV